MKTKTTTTKTKDKENKNAPASASKLTQTSIASFFAKPQTPKPLAQTTNTALPLPHSTSNAASKPLENASKETSESTKVEEKVNEPQKGDKDPPTDPKRKKPPTNPLLRRKTQKKQQMLLLSNQIMESCAFFFFVRICIVFTATSTQSKPATKTSYHFLQSMKTQILYCCNGKPLAEMPLLPSGAVLSELESNGFISSSADSAADDIMMDSPDSNNDDSLVPSDKKKEIEDLGAKGRAEAQFWLNAYAGIQTATKSSSSTSLVQHPMYRTLQPQNSSNSKPFLISSTIRTYIPQLQSSISFSLASLHETLQNASTPHLSTIYTSLIRTLQSEKRWHTMTTPIETQALIIHHLLTVPSSTTLHTPSSPSIDALITFFTDIPLPSIPAPVHIRLLGILVDGITAGDKFREFMETEVVGGLESRRKKLGVNLKRRGERLEREIKVFGGGGGAGGEKVDDVVCEEDGVGMDVDCENATDSARLEGVEAEKVKSVKEAELNAKLASLVEQLNKKIEQVSAYEKELSDLDKEDALLKDEIEALGESMRGVRFLGTDRDFSTYLWIDTVLPTHLHQPPTKNQPFGIFTLKLLIKSLNDRGVRERELCTRLRERLKPMGLDIPAFPTFGTKRAWERLGSEESEMIVSSAMDSFAACVAELGCPVACAEAEEYHEMVVEGVRERVRELLSVTDPRVLGRREVNALERMQEFVDAVEGIIAAVFGEEEGEEVRERFEGVTNWSLFSVAVGFVVSDVGKGKFGKAGSGGVKAKVDKEEKDGEVAMTRSGRAVKATVPVVLKKVKKVDREAVEKRTLRSKEKKVSYEERQEESDEEEEEEDDDGEAEVDEDSETGSTVDSDSGDEDEDDENSDIASRSSEVVVTRASRKRLSDSSEECAGQRVTRARRGESAAVNVVDVDTHQSALSRLQQSRSERLARRSHQ
ncbi:hypothetical protein BCR33DRAFT_782873 [Rhizoclosmatium globosum]|uniref:Uncharacterized protein n=1 Tax=Rhizoclosmatium globosum TaxID=329046 RepID=A0A1Y2CL94_9FUNG|nr:hypothetical protein BCR33DRAFT_782873 [Rhizoclosmatium globosum]|eukprot:ORY47802.1 hypothetical protein BCR33DRAFT_782873 [Rhizoclosmatium globosum]